ncbi:MAG: ExeA family protein [Candidatus Hadarchaeum sp.]|uniref:ExeA family protein n=1 Tax=Candidatus Hadarchaeum sp. TaxID=2883567 RepID=UPI003D11F0DF
MTTFDEKIGKDQRFEAFIQRWGLKKDPFSFEMPSIDAFAPSQQEDIRKIKQLLLEGKVGVLTGDLGMGKTTLCEFLVSALREESLSMTDPSKQTIPILVHGAAYKSSGEIIRAILLALEMPVDKDDASLFDVLRRWHHDHQERLIIIIDDIPESGANVLEIGEFLRVLSDIPNISILINGEKNQMQRFLDKVPSLRDRVQLYVELEPMSKETIKDLLKLRLKSAGCLNYDALITPDGFDAIYKLSKGNPRLALKVADKALHLAAALDVPIDERVVKKANKVSFWRRLFG